MDDLSYEDFAGYFVFAFIEAIIWLPEIVQKTGELAKAEEEKRTKELKDAKVGDKFLEFPVLHVDPAADTVTLQVTLKGIDVPGVPGLKIATAQANIVIKRWVNLTTSSKEPVRVIGLEGFAIEVEVSRNEQYTIRLGYAEDTSDATPSQMLLVDVDWKAPEFALTGLLGRTDHDGILIDVAGTSPVPIPLGPTPVALKGAGLLYGKHFAPRFNVPPEKVMERLATATATDYVDWLARPKDLTTWTGVRDEIETYGLSATLVDTASAGNAVRLSDFGIAYVSYGPTMILKGRTTMLKSIDVGSVTGAIDGRSKTAMMRITQTFDVLPFWEEAAVATGTAELFVSFTGQPRSYLAIGNFAMDGCRVTLLGFLELNGGIRLIFEEGVALRARGRLVFEGDILGVGGGTSFLLDVEGSFGWNPLNIRCRVEVAGSIWFEIAGRKFGFGVQLLTLMSFRQPLEMRIDFEFTFKIWFVEVNAHLYVFDHLEPKPSTPKPTLAATSADPVGTIHPPSGTVARLTDEDAEIWPDTILVIDFQRQAGGATNIINPVSGHLSEAGVDVVHLFDLLAVERHDPEADAWTEMRDVRASWLLDASGGGTRASSRLAIPCNDPLSWLQRFDYAQPATSKRLPRYQLQAFGAGDTRRYEAVSGIATATFENVVIDAPADFWLVPVAWSGSYDRAIDFRMFSVDFEAGPHGTASRLGVERFELRILSRRSRELQIGVGNGKTTGPRVIRRLDGDMAEWVLPVTRTDPAHPVRFSSELPMLLAAVGWWREEEIANDPPDLSVLEPGRYRLRTSGHSTATFRGVSADPAPPWGLTREFKVVRPPLRPYIRYSTLGDERAFGLDAGRWNPNPLGQSFGHYPAHLGQIRSSVGYLDAIYPSLLVRTAEGEAYVKVDVSPCAQGTLAGTKASAEWRVETGLPPAVERELTFVVATQNAPPLPGTYRASVKRIEADGSPGDVIDEWAYRVSRYPSPSDHLTLAAGLTRRISPFGNTAVPASSAPPLPEAFDFEAAARATASPRWVLPAAVARLGDVDDPRAGLSFLHLLEWCGLLSRPLAENELGPFARPDQPDISVVMDRARAPCAFLIRTAEPCDWRRVSIDAVTGYADANPLRFATKIIPSPDGCQCLLILMASDLPVRIPRTSIALRLRFALESPGLPRLTARDDPARTFDEVRVALDQPFGPAPEEM